MGSFHRHLASLGRLDLDCGDSDNVLLTIGPVRAQNPIENTVLHELRVARLKVAVRCNDETSKRMKSKHRLLKRPSSILYIHHCQAILKHGSTYLSFLCCFEMTIFLVIREFRAFRKMESLTAKQTHKPCACWSYYVRRQANSYKT